MKAVTWLLLSFVVVFAVQVNALDFNCQDLTTDLRASDKDRCFASAKNLLKLTCLKNAKKKLRSLKECDFSIRYQSRVYWKTQGHCEAKVLAGTVSCPDTVPNKFKQRRHLSGGGASEELDAGAVAAALANVNGDNVQSTEANLAGGSGSVLATDLSQRDSDTRLAALDPSATGDIPDEDAFTGADDGNVFFNNSADAFGSDDSSLNEEEPGEADTTNEDLDRKLSGDSDGDNPFTKEDEEEEKEREKAAAAPSGGGGGGPSGGGASNLDTPQSGGQDGGGGAPNPL